MGDTAPLPTNAQVVADMAQYFTGGDWLTHDRWLSIVSIVIGCIAIAVSAFIAYQQEQTQKLYIRKVLGTIPSVPDFMKRLCRVLDDADEDPDAGVFAMLYWTWFGADLAFPASPVAKIDAAASNVFTKLDERIRLGKETTVVCFDPVTGSKQLQSFLRLVLAYNRVMSMRRGSRTKAEPSEEDIQALYQRYADSFAALRQMALKGNGKTSVLGKTEISAIMVAVTGKTPVALLLLLETSALEGFATPAGFESSEPRMVQVIQQQITIAGGTE